LTVNAVMLKASAAAASVIESFRIVFFSPVVVATTKVDGKKLDGGDRSPAFFEMPSLWTNPPLEKSKLPRLITAARKFRRESRHCFQASQVKRFQTTARLCATVDALCSTV
jgi:hypothetical protein